MEENKILVSPKVAIVVPIYNPGVSALSRALQSLCAQTLREFEIICVLDCPKDGSDAFVYELSKTNDRIIVIQNEINQGVSHSRNAGIARAVLDGAEFIGFMDHDDYVAPEMFEKLYHHAVSQKFDVVRCNTIIEFQDRIVKDYFNDTSWEGMVRSLLLPMHSSKNPNYLSRSVWNTIYKTEIVKQIRFKDRSIYYEEDTLYNLSVCAKTKNIGYIPEEFYHWVKTNDSLSQERVEHHLVCSRILNYFEYEWQLLKENQMERFAQELYINISWFLRHYRIIFPTMEGDYQKRLGHLLKDCKFPIFGRYEDLKIVSKARLKLFIMVIKLKKI